MELKFIEIGHAILRDSQGTMASQVEKVDKALSLMNEYATSIGQDHLNASILKNKIDSIKKKAKAAYKAVRIHTNTGANVE